MAIEIVDQVNGWLKTAMSAIFHPTAKPGNNLQQIIMSETRDFGPSVLTGGQLHKINSATATLVANEIIATAPVVQQVLKGSVTQAIVARQTKGYAAPIRWNATNGAAVGSNRREHP